MVTIYSSGAWGWIPSFAEKPTQEKTFNEHCWKEKGGMGEKGKSVKGKGKEKEEGEEERAINYFEKNSLKTASFYWTTPYPFFLS